MGGILQALKGTGGEYEVTRVVGAIGALSYIVCANAYVAYDIIWVKHAFDLTAYCLAFPTGLAASVGSIAGAAAYKDKNVAIAKRTQAGTDAGVQPTSP